MNHNNLNNMLNSNREITSSIINSSPILLVSQLEGSFFQDIPGEIKINAAGLIRSNDTENINNNINNNNNEEYRKENDGDVLFGNNPDFKSDVILNLTNPLLEQYKKYPYIFSIYFKKETKCYYIKAYSGEGADNRLVFVKLTAGQDLIISKREIITIGNTIFQVLLIDNENIELTVILSKHKEKLGDKVKKVYNKNEMSEISLGRDENCTYPFINDKAFSRQQTLIKYENGNWVIKDGDGIKSSLNGTWVFGLHSFQIKDEMIVEVLTSKLKFKLI